MSNRWERHSDHELELVYLQAAAENFQWMLDSSSLENDRLVIRGWALTLAGEPHEARFLINGEPFEMTHYPLPSPDIAAIFWNIPTAKTARFTCETRIDDSTYANGFACLEFLDGSDRDHARRRAWYLPEPYSDLAVPNPSQVSRVIGTPDPANYLIGGAAIYKRLEKYLEGKLSKTFDDFPRILDFGCGCGRVARNLRWARQSKVWGVDVDGQNIAWCREHLAHGSFQQIEPVPPLPFPEDYFDLVFAVSILSQLIEEYQCVWLRELQRVVKKDGIILASITGLTQVGLARPDPQLLRRIEEKGFLVTGRNRDLDAAVDTPTYYVSGLHSLDYVREQWGKYFTIVDVVPALVANDDLVVMRNDQPLQEAVLSLPTPAKLSTGEDVDRAQENPFALPLRDYDINPFIHPTAAKRGYDGHLVDMEGRDYVDLMSAWGTNILGYGYRKVARAVSRQAKQFNCLGLPYPQFNELMDLMRKFVPSAEEVRYGKNGSDACAGAVRLARAITGREKILYRGYHGFHDWYFASTDCPGIPNALRSTIVSQPDLAPSAVDAAFRKHPLQIAALIMNPLTGPYPTSTEMQEVIDIVHGHGALVIFDEMMTGFRVALGGMQELWSVKPDLSCFGKSIANGLPLSVLCGKGEFIRRLPETYYGMTFEGESVSIAAAHATITEVIKKDVVGALYQKGRRIRASYERLAAGHNIASRLGGFEPCMTIEFADAGTVTGRELLWLMNQELVRNGVFTLGAFILCFSHNNRDIRKIEQAIDSSMRVVRQAIDAGTSNGLLDERIRERLKSNLINAPATWRRAQ